MVMKQSTLSGSCLCGAIRFELKPPIRDVIVCHCRQCAKWTGYAVAATAVAPDNFRLAAGAEVLSWFSSSESADRGFCNKCGSSLFWRPADKSRISILAGSLEPPTALKIAAHIFMDDKSDFYDVCDGAPRFAGGAGDLSLVRD
jgi:hypothetical protein